MGLSGGAIVARALADEGVGFAFGIPGTHNIELYDALALSAEVRLVLVTDEQSASFMADAVWRASGRLACANVVPGAGLTHAMSGIAEAFMDNVPMLVLGCGIRRDTDKSYQLHDVDQVAMVRPVTKAQLVPRSGAELYRAIREACRIAREGAPGPAFVEVPANLYLTTHDVDLPEEHFGAQEALDAGRADEQTGKRAEPLDEAAKRAVSRAIELLSNARQPLIYAGLGAAPAGAALADLAARLHAPVCTTFQGKGVYPESLGMALWPGFGAAAPPFVRDIAKECDATLAIGCRFGEVATASYSFDPPRPLIHIDIDPTVPGRNYPADVAIIADAAAAVPFLAAALPARPFGDALASRIVAGHESVRRHWEAQAGSETVAPYLLLRALQQRLGPETIYCTDSGNGTFLAMEMLRLDRPGKFLAPVDYSCMGYSVPAAIGAKLARPDCPVVGLVGDGAFLMTGLELLTAAHTGAAAAFFVLRDHELAQIAQFQSVALNRKTASILPDYDLASLCAGLGVECLKLERNEEIPALLERVVATTAAGLPVVIDTAIDYSNKTFFTGGVVKTTLGRMAWPDRLRFIGRAVGRKIFG
ncbi:MAG TPA: thiamine pyrophosphate-binding protein [Gemmatimonadales bacterium]|jgi:acetolactate synthase-1/2/3 large subunit